MKELMHFFKGSVEFAYVVFGESKGEDIIKAAQMSITRKVGCLLKGLVM
jgi:hypothetical protein